MSEQDLENNSTEIISIPSVDPNVNHKLFEVKVHRTFDNKIEPINAKREESKSLRIQKCLKEKIKESTIHALPMIFKTDRFFFKIMWVVLFVITFYFNIQYTIRSINEFLLYETITQIEIGFEQPGNLNITQLEKHF